MTYINTVEVLVVLNGAVTAISSPDRRYFTAKIVTFESISLILERSLETKPRQLLSGQKLYMTYKLVRSVGCYKWCHYGYF